MSSQFHDAPPPANLQAPRPEAVVREHSTYMTDRDAEKLCQLFADGLRSGVGYARILDFMDRQRLDPKMTARLRVAVLEYGDRLGEAFARIPDSSMHLRGNSCWLERNRAPLPETFKEQAKIYGDRYKRKKTVLYGLIESVLIFCLGAFYFRNLISNITLIAMAKDWGPLPDLMILATIQSAVFAMVFGGLGYFWLNLPVDSSLRETLGRVWFRIPVLSAPIRLQAIGSFARYLRQSIRSGMDMFLSIDLAAEATNSPFFASSIEEVFGVLEAGYPLDQAMRYMKGLPNDFIDYVGIGEETGNLEENLLFLADRYDDLAVEAYKRSLTAFVYVTRMVFIVAILIFVVFGGVLENMMFDL